MNRDPRNLPAPARPDAPPRELVTALGREVGSAVAARWCADLLAGADPADYTDVFGYLGPNCAQAAFDPGWHDYWHRTWGARGLLYVWADAATPAVVAGLADEHWRPAEMCLKVAAKRELGQAGPGVAALAGHELPRVRAAAIHCLGVVGDVEHLPVIRAALDDPEVAVRAAADRALTRAVARLDVDRDG